MAASSIERATFDYLSSLEWITAKENPLFVGPAGTGKSHCLVALGHAAIEAGMRVRYFTAEELVETLYRGLADNSVGRVIDQTLRADVVLVDEVGFAPLDDAGAQLLFRFVAAAYERVPLGIASHWPFDEWGRFLPERTAHHRFPRYSAQPRSSRTPGPPTEPGRQYLDVSVAPVQQKMHLIFRLAVRPLSGRPQAPLCLKPT